MAEVRRHGTRWRVRVKINGTREWKPLPAEVRTEAEAKAVGARMVQLIRAGIARKREDLTAPEGEPSVSWGDRWFADRERRGLQVKVDRGRLRKWVWPVFGARPMGELTRGEIEALVRALDEHVRAGRLAWKSASNVWGLVTKMCRDACSSKNPALRVRTDDPCRGVQGPDRGQAKELAYLHPIEAARLLECERVPVRWRRLYALALYIGLRAGEVEGLEVEDLDFEARTITIARSVEERSRVTKTPKNGRSRRIAMPEPVIELLKTLSAEAVAKGRSRLVTMPPRSGHDSIASKLRRHLKRAGVLRRELHETSPTTRQITFHDLRGTCVTWWALQGTDGLVIQLRAGHADLKTTSRYVRAAAALRGVEGGTPFFPLPFLGPPAGPPASALRARNTMRDSDLERRPQRDSNPLLTSPDVAKPAFLLGAPPNLASSGDASLRAGGHAGGPPASPPDLDRGLRDLLSAALERGDHDLAEQLLGILRGRAEGPGTARAGTGTGGVIDLNQRRRERHGR